MEFVHDVTFEVPENISRNWFKRFPGYNWLAGIEIDDSGRVFIADHSFKMIHVFDSEGSYVTSLGREGNGPGEYQSITDTEIFSQKLHVFDWMKFRTTTYSLDSLKDIETEDVRPPVNMGEIDKITGWFTIRPLLRSEGTYLAGFIEDWPNANVGSPKYNLGQDRPMKFFFMDNESYIFSDEIFELKKGREDLVAQVGDRHLFNLRTYPFLARSLITISNDNHIYTTWTKNFLIKVYGPDGAYLRAFYHPYQRKILRREEVLPLFDGNDEWGMRDLVQHAELPETWPAIKSIITDDKNRLWVSKIVSDDVYEWWVLQDTGELVAKFRWPENRSIEAVKNGYAYSHEADEETGIQKILRYRIEMEKN
ncbi:6-bladed beta-propeller [Fodinibius roseus]|uniref:6-bladed beta-propeller n=1 Tax=Fodinibius roseus TaxID=1194090 RepID=UPI00148176B3|nr:6-bladed beta-propeller [Fodinibius roseus]